MGPKLAGDTHGPTSLCGVVLSVCPPWWAPPWQPAPFPGFGNHFLHMGLILCMLASLGLSFELVSDRL